MKRFTTYSDESGIASTGKKFIVTTVIVLNNNCESFQDLLKQVELESGKNKKWTDVGVKIRTSYLRLLLKKNIFSLCTAYFSVYRNKEDYSTLFSSQIARSILSYSDNDKYNATIFFDKVNNRITNDVQKDIKRYKIRFKKMRALDDNNNTGLQLADALCGLIRDIENKNIDISYKTVFKKLKEI